MKKILFLLVSLSFCSITFSQTVENIRVDTQGDEIRVTYRIGGSTESQLFNVTLSCSMDGGPRFEPAAVMGDVGANIRGGKAIYTILWDVFEDVDQVDNAEFFVKVDLVSDLNRSTSPEPVSEEQKVKEVNRAALEPEEEKAADQKMSYDKKIFIAYNGSVSSPVGLSAGLLMKWGFNENIRVGWNVNDYESNIWVTSTTGLARFIAGKGKYRLHGYAGLGFSVEYYEEYFYYTSWGDTYFVAETGLIGVIGMLDLTLGVEYNSYYGADLVFGVGIVF